VVFGWVMQRSQLVIEHKSLLELDDVHNIINWGEIEQTLSNLYTSKTGASAYPPIMMFKILILQAWYALVQIQVSL
jgi:IS5 family transposase